MAEFQFYVNLTCYTVLCGPHHVRTTVTASPSVVVAWVNYTLRHRSHYLRLGRLVVGLRVQWPPGGHFAAATLQLCAGNSCLIYQLSGASSCLDELHRFLVDPRAILVGVWNYMDVGMLRESPHRLNVGRLVDLRDLASDLRGFDRSESSMPFLAAEILGMHGMVEGEAAERSNWAAEELSAEQMTYACHDVFLSFLIAKILRIWDWVRAR